MADFKMYKSEYIDTIEEQMQDIVDGATVLYTQDTLLTLNFDLSNDTTIVPKSDFNGFNAFQPRKTLIKDKAGTLGMYLRDQDNDNIVVATITTSIAINQSKIYSDVGTHADLPLTISDATTKFGEAPTVGGSVSVLADETMNGERINWTIVSIDGDGNITWGNPVEVNSGNYQSQSTVEMAGKLLTGSGAGGSFGTPISVSTSVAANTSIPNNNAVYIALANKQNNIGTNNTSNAVFLTQPANSDSINKVAIDSLIGYDLSGSISIVTGKKYDGKQVYIQRVNFTTAEDGATKIVKFPAQCSGIVPGSLQGEITTDIGQKLPLQYIQPEPNVEVLTLMLTVINKYIISNISISGDNTINLSITTIGFSNLPGVALIEYTI